MGLIVVFINMDYGWWPATIAGLKQAAYTFLFGGLIIKMLEILVDRFGQSILGVILASLITSAVTISLVFLVHSLRGTPMPFESTLPAILLAPPGFFAIAYRRMIRTGKSRQQSEVKRSDVPGRTK